MLPRHSPLCCSCAAALCYPKVTGGKVQKAMKKCPDGFTLEKDGSGKAMCVQQSSSNWLAAAAWQQQATVDRPLTLSAQPRPAQQSPVGQPAGSPCRSSIRSHCLCISSCAAVPIQAAFPPQRIPPASQPKNQPDSQAAKHTSQTISSFPTPMITYSSAIAPGLENKLFLYISCVCVFRVCLCTTGA